MFDRIILTNKIWFDSTLYRKSIESYPSVIVLTSKQLSINYWFFIYVTQPMYIVYS